MRVFILFSFVYRCSCYYAIVASLSRKSQEMTRTMFLSCASQHAPSHTYYAVEIGANFLESFSPFRNSKQISRSCETNPLGETNFISPHVSIVTLTARWLFYVVPALGLRNSWFLLARLYLFFMIVSNKINQLRSYLNEKSSGSRSRKQRWTAVGTRCADHVTPLYQQKLALRRPAAAALSV